MTLRRALVLGASGQVGNALNALLPDDAVLLSRDEADLARPETLRAALEHYRPEIVINAAAYTAVDKAESEPELACAINAEAPGVIAEFCKSRDIPFVHYSTDYVFNGAGSAAWRETDATDPQNVYGQTKRAGEEAVEAAGGKYLIFRTSWVYDAYGKNFVNTMLQLAAEREELKIVNDQFGAPTYAPHLAQATLTALERAMQKDKFPSGIYHLCGGGETNWYNFALEIFELARGHGVEFAYKRVLAVSSDAFPAPARRPKNSRLDCAKARSILGVILPAWEEGLRECLEVKYEST